ncbi:hypothetical protein LPJ66_010977, partial [Kickxella alabastrina]
MGTSAGASASAQSSGTYADGDVASSIASAAVRRKRSRKQRRRKRGNSSAKSTEGSSSSNTLADLQSHDDGGAKTGGIDVHAMQANVEPLTVALMAVGVPEGDGSNPSSSNTNTNNSIAEDIGIITDNDNQQESEEMLGLHPASRTASLYSVVPARSIAPSSPQLAAEDMYNANAYSERCSMHPGLRNDMWCEDCSAAICDHCTTSGTHHQGHIVVKLSAAYDDTFEAIEEMQLELMDRLAETRQRHTLLDSERTLLNDTYEMAQELIEEQAKTDGDHIGMQFNVAEIVLLNRIKACTLWREHIDEAVELVQKMIEEFPQAQAVAERGRFVDLLAAATEARPDNWDEPLPKARAMLDHVQPPSSEAALVVPRVMDLGRKRGHLRVAGEPFSAHGLTWQIEAKRARNRDGQSALYASLSCVESPGTGMPHMVSVHLAPATATAAAGASPQPGGGGGLYRQHHTMEWAKGASHDFELCVIDRLGASGALADSGSVTVWVTVRAESFRLLAQAQAQRIRTLEAQLSKAKRGTAKDDANDSGRESEDNLGDVSALTGSLRPAGRRRRSEGRGWATSPRAPPRRSDAHFTTAAAAVAEVAAVGASGSLSPSSAAMMGAALLPLPVAHSDVPEAETNDALHLFSMAQADALLSPGAAEAAMVPQQQSESESVADAAVDADTAGADTAGADTAGANAAGADATADATADACPEEPGLSAANGQRTMSLMTKLRKAPTIPFPLSLRAHSSPSHPLLISPTKNASQMSLGDSASTGSGSGS